MAYWKNICREVVTGDCLEAMTISVPGGIYLPRHLKQRKAARTSEKDPCPEEGGR